MAGRRGDGPRGHTLNIRKLERQLEADRVSGVSVPTEPVRSSRPIDQWPIAKEAFRDLAVDDFLQQEHDCTKSVRKIVAEVAGRWANQNAAYSARDISRRWGDWRGGVEMIDWQFFYDIQARRETLIPDGAAVTVKRSIQHACEAAGIDYVNLNSITGRIAVAHTGDPFQTNRYYADGTNRYR